MRMFSCHWFFMCIKFWLLETLRNNHLRPYSHKEQRPAQSFFLISLFSKCDCQFKQWFLSLVISPDILPLLCPGSGMCLHPLCRRHILADRSFAFVDNSVAAWLNVPDVWDHAFQKVSFPANIWQLDSLFCADTSSEKVVFKEGSNPGDQTTQS